jgi:hypothetical protein
MGIFPVGMEGLIGMKEAAGKVLLDIRVIMAQLGMKPDHGVEAAKLETVKAG